MKKSILIALTFFCFHLAKAQTAGVPCADLFISEYIEGSSFNKAIELYNPTPSTINLTGYTLKRFSNGSPTVTATFNLSGSVLPGDVYVIIMPLSNSPDPALVAARDTANTIVNYNGDDAMLLQNANGDSLDIIGQIGVDPGISWLVNSSDSTANMTLVRKPGIHNGTTNWAASAAGEWIGYPINTFSYIGSHTMTSCGAVPQTISWTTSSQTVLESAGTITIPVHISNANPSATTVDVTVLGGTATGGGADYTIIATQTLTFPATTTADQVASLTIIDDALIEGNETILLQLSNPTNGASIASVTNDTITIQDNDFALPTLSFQLPTSVTVGENGGSVVATVLLGSPNANATSVDIQLKAATATAGSDFTFANQTITFPANSATPINVTIPIINNCIPEASENFQIVLRNATNSAAIGADSVFNTIISDDDATPTVSFTPGNVNTNEAAGVFNLNVNISTPNCDTTKVTVSLTGGSAVSGIDYTATLPTVVVFPPMFTGTKQVPINLINDLLPETLDSLLFSLSNPTNGAVLGTTAKKLFIFDNDTAKLNFTNAAQTVAENVGAVTVPVTLTNGGPTTITVDVSVTGGSAIFGSDFTGGTQTLTFPTGTTTQNATFTIIDDATVESTETIILGLSNVTGGGILAAAGAQNVYTITITDNDVLPISVSFGTASATVNENAGTINMPLAISNPGTTSPVVSFSVTGTCTSGSDFTFISSSPHTIAAGVSVDNLQLNIIDDATVETSETIICTITNVTGGQVGATSIYTLTVNDNDGSGISIANSNSGQVNVVPNPATNDATLTVRNVSQTGEVHFELYNILGKKLISEKLYDNKIDLGQHNLNDGVYFYKVIQGSTVRDGKLVIK